MFGKKSETPQKNLLLTTTMTLQRLYDELGLAYSYTGPYNYEKLCAVATVAWPVATCTRSAISAAAPCRTAMSEVA